MHLSNALISPTTAIVGGAVAAALVVVAVLKSRPTTSREGFSAMGATALFLLVAQMINISTSLAPSSGHLIGAILAAALLGPWRGYLTVAVVIVVQALVFHDGGTMAIGCNILNMGAAGCLVAYPLLFRPLMDMFRRRPFVAIMMASVASSVVAVGLGSGMVVAENALSGAGYALPTAEFLALMVPTHLGIGALEGVASGLLLYVVWVVSPYAVESWGLSSAVVSEDVRRRHRRTLTISLFACALILGAVALSSLPSSKPDGLEWSVERLTSNV